MTDSQERGGQWRGILALVVVLLLCSLVAVTLAPPANDGLTLNEGAAPLSSEARGAPSSASDTADGEQNQLDEWLDPDGTDEPAAGGVMSFDPDDPALQESPGPERARVTVTVVNAIGEPVAGVEVSVDNSMGGQFGTTGPDGRVTVEVGQSIYNVVAEQELADGTQNTGRSAVRTFWGKETAHTVTLDRTALLTVEVNEALSQWKVVLLAREKTPSPFPGVFPDEERLELTSERSAPNPDLQGFDELTRDRSDGPDHLLSMNERVRPGEYDLIVYGFDDPITAAETTVRLTGGDQRVSVRLRPQGTLSVSVLDADGQPERAHIQLLPLEDRHGRLAPAYDFPFPQGIDRLPADPESVELLETEDDGTLSLPERSLSPGRWKAVAIPSDPTLARGEAELVVRSGARAQVRIALPRTRSVNVRCNQALVGIGEFTAFGPPGIALRQLDDTTLQVTGLRPGDSAVVIAQRDPFNVGPPVVGRADITATSTEAFLEVGPPARLTGQVVNTHGHPLGTAGVEFKYTADPSFGRFGVSLLLAEDEDPQEGSYLEDEELYGGFTSKDTWQTDADGTFSGLELPPGRWRFWLPGGKEQVLQLSLGEERRLVLDMPR